MTVRNTIHAGGIDLLRDAQTAWQEVEYVNRAAFAHVRLDSLSELFARLTPTDCFDAAYAIWDDYIDGRHHDERLEPLTTAQLREQASVFARVAAYVGGKEAFALAAAAWGDETFEVFTRTPDGRITGKLGWYRADTLNITYATPDPITGRASSLWVVRAWQCRRKHVHAEVFASNGRPVALHPAFARADS